MGGALGGGPFREDGVHGEGDVFPHGQPREQRVVLENQAAFGAGLGDGLALEGDGALVGAGEAGDEGHEGGLALAGVADDGDELSLGDGEVDVAQDGLASVVFGYAGELKEGHGRKILKR